MSGISAKPESLTKDRLRSDLEKFGVEVPSSSAKKEVYVQLYRTHLLSRQSSGFSSDEDLLENTASQKKGRPGSPRKSMSKRGSETVNVEGFSDRELADQLKALGVDIGPILDSTRRLYQKKLAKLLAERTRAEPAGSKEGSQDSHDTLILESDPEPEGKTSSIWASKRPSRGQPSVAENWATQDTQLLDVHDRNGHEFSDSDVDMKPSVSDKKRSYRKTTTTTSTYKTEVKDSGRRKYTEPSFADRYNYSEPSGNQRTTYISYEEQMDPDSPDRSSLLSRRHIKKEVTETPDAVDGKFGVAANHAKGKETKKSGMSRWLQIIIIVVVVAIIFLILNTMEPAKKSGIGALPGSSS